MKTTSLNTLFLLLVVRRIGQGFLALFRFTEADILALLSSYGGCAFEVDHLQNNPPLLKKEAERKLVETSQPKGIFGSIPIGVHPDFTLANWATASRSQLFPKSCSLPPRHRLEAYATLTPSHGSGGREELPSGSISTNRSTLRRAM
jgi:hypothetical protein